MHEKDILVGGFMARGRRRGVCGGVGRDGASVEEKDVHSGGTVRLSWDKYFMQLAFLAAERGTCPRRKVGCILVDSRHHVLATGYGGVPVGVVHCNDSQWIKNPASRKENEILAMICPAWAAPSGEGLDGCGAVHAEQNAILQCRDVFAIDTAYVTTFPCLSHGCVKLLLNTTCRRIVYAQDYQRGRKLWEMLGREAYKYRDPIGG